MKILKTLWHRGKDGRWAIDAFCPLDLKGKKNADDTLFEVADGVVTNQASPVVGVPFLGIGTTQSFLGESVVPIVANVHGD
jgi:hypothetical protein